MLNYARWLADSLAFLERLRGLPGEIQVEVQIAPPAQSSELPALQEMARLTIPASLQRFWREASRHAQGRYSWVAPPAFHSQMRVAFPRWAFDHMWGGPDFLSAEEICGLTHDTVSWSESFAEDSPRDARIWLHSFPLIQVGNGDAVGLYVRDDQDDPPVAYLCHEGSGGSRIIAPNLDTFLQCWADVGYVGMDFLMNFCFPERHIDPAGFPLEREATRTLLSGIARPDLVRPTRTMTKREWDECRDSEPMLDWLKERGVLDKARLRNYGCLCCRRIWDRLGPWTQRAVEVAERFTRGEATPQELAEARAWLAGGNAGKQNLQKMRGSNSSQEGISDSIAFSKSQGPFHRIAYCVIDGSSWISWEITSHLDDPEIATERAAHAQLLRHVFGDPF